MSNFVKELNKANFTETLESNQIVLVDVWATWCGPCKALSPIIDELGEHYQNEVIISKLEADSNSDLVSELSIRTVPTIILFKDGLEVERISGTKTKKALIELIDKYNTTVTTDFSSNEDF